jgi:hypothetical protein
MDNLPPDFAGILERSLNRVDAQHLKTETDLVPSVAIEMLPNITAKLKSNSAGGSILEKPEDENERKLIDYLVSFCRVRPAFTAKRLYKEFSDALLINDLLSQNEMKSLAWTEPIVALFAIEHLHGSSVLLEDESVVSLRATAYSEPYNGDRTLGVGAYMIIPRKNKSGPPRRVLHGSSIFATELYADEWCDETLSQRPFELWWPYPIELTNDGKLSKIGRVSTLSFPSLGERAELGA